MTTSYIEVLVHFIKGNVGPGMLAMGYAFKNGGMIVSFILTPVLALLCLHCEHILLESAEQMQILHNKYSTDFAETIEICFLNGPRKIQSWASGMKLTVNVFICATQLGFCCVYFEFIAANVHQILLVYNIDTNVHYLMLMAYLPILLVSLITNLKWLTPVSLFANICLISGFAITLFFAFKDGLPNIEERRMYPDHLKLALFFGTTIYAFEGIALVLPLKNAMKKPEQFGSALGVLNIGMFIAMALFITCGAVGYWKWGEEVKGSVTLNIGESALAQTAKLLVVLGVLFGYPIQFFIAIQIMLPQSLKVMKCIERPLLGELLFRTLMVTVTFIIAESVPELALFISLIGSVCSTALAFIFPTVIEFVLLAQNEKPKVYKYFVILKDINILIIGLLGFALGSGMSLFEMYKAFSRYQYSEVNE